ncbi:hypothetical protein C2G38_2175774 [Gigaspora rosea]|uniref:Uncharacterized protein n=1 Tax=Gigaspora rosea TaxID=44941 RepID=A0A397VPB2_9GLOM|nr:hypothetical protein C2G38_2175774 [Gigaspora rosea]
MDGNSAHDSAKKCVVKICKGAPALKWKKITKHVLTKAQANGTLASYYKDHKDEYMCLNCYNSIVVNGTTYIEHADEWARGSKRRRNDTLSMAEIAEDKNDQLGFFFNEIEAMACLERKNEAERRALERSLTYQSSDDNLSWVDSVNVLTKLLYDREKNEQEPVIYSFKQLCREMVVKDFRLNKKLAVECYIICGNQNSKLTAFKKDISLFVDFMGVSTEAIDALSYAGITISRRHLDRIKTDIADNHSNRVTLYLEVKKDKALVLNIDDYHNIHTPRTPDMFNIKRSAYDDLVAKWC